MSKKDYDENLFEFLNPEELIVIQQEYRKKKLKETLVGPLVSTAFHLVLILVASLFKAEVKKPSPQIELTQAVDNKPELPIPKPLPRPEPKEPDLDTPIETDLPIVETMNKMDIKFDSEENIDSPPAVELLENVTMPKDLKPSTSNILSDSSFISRSPEGKNRARTIHRVSEASTQSLLRALDWLAQNQRPDGSWGNSGVTGLALLAYLANGDTPKSQRYGKTVAKAIQWLASSSPGAELVYTPDLDDEKRIVGIKTTTQENLAYYASGPLAVRATGDVNVAHGYPHAIKVYALAEAYMMTKNYSLERPLKHFARLLIKGQKPEGDFDYNYKKGPRWDNSISFWNYQALKALSVSGLEIDGLGEAIEKAIPRMKLMAKFHFPYSGTSKPSSGRGNTGLAAAGALCLQLLGAGQNDKNVDKIMDRLYKESLPQLDWDKSPKKWVMYAWYYQTFAMFQHGGKYWKEWNSAFQKVLMKNQHPEGYWAHELAWGAGKNIEAKAYQTAMGALMFTVYFRYGIQSQRFSLKDEKQIKKQTINEDELIEIF